MPKLEFPFTPNRVVAAAWQPQGIAYRPQLAATISAPNGRSVRFLTLLDTGADGCLFPMSAALLLGLDVLSLPKAYTGGVGSQANLTVYEKVTIDAGRGLSFTTIAGFTAGLDAVGLGLLGHTGFFERYDVEFRHRDKVFAISLD